MNCADTTAEHHMACDTKAGEDPRRMSIDDGDLQEFAGTPDPAMSASAVEGPMLPLRSVLDSVGRPLQGMKQLLTRFTAIWLGSVGLTGAQGQAQPRQPVDVARLGPQTGERVPDFTLPDQNGKT